MEPATYSSPVTGALQLMLALAAVIALAYLILNKGLGTFLKRRRSGELIQIKERVALDSKNALVIVETQGQSFLLATSDRGVSLISKLSVMAIILFSQSALAADDITKLANTDLSTRPLMLLLIFAAISVAPFVGMLVTSFVKIAIVLSITRQAIGLQQVPPSPVITGLAILLTVYVMQPVGIEVFAHSQKFFEQHNQTFLDKSNVDLLMQAVRASETPMKNFLKKHASPRNIQMFYDLSLKMRSPADRDSVTMSDYLILIPAFVITELTEAFQIGFIIFLPFLIVDMVVSNILMALGMQMLSPTTISLPFKILLFVLVDGWHMITKGLVLGYF
jgi:type III secretion protein R